MCCALLISCVLCSVVLLFVMSCFQFFFSSLRLLLLLSGTAEEMAPQESESLFAAFAITVGSAPIIHVRATTCRRSDVEMQIGVCLVSLPDARCVVCPVPFSFRLAI